MKSRKPLIRTLFFLLLTLYPFLVYLGLEHFPPGALGVLLIVFLALRLGVISREERSVVLPMLATFMAYAALAAATGSEKLLLGYPVLVNFFLAAIFANSIRKGAPLLLRIVQARKQKISDYAPKYLTRLTAVWAGFFVLNGLVALWSMTKNLEIWTLYNGFIAYMAAGTLMGAELIFRIYYKKKKGVHKDE